MNFQELSLSSQLMYVAMYETWKLLKALLREVEKQHEEERDLVRNVNAVDGDLDTVPDEEMLRLTVNCLANNTDLRQQQQLYHHSALEVVAADRETTAVSAAASPKAVDAVVGSRGKNVAKCSASAAFRSASAAAATAKHSSPPSLATASGKMLALTAAVADFCR